ncbi:NnrS family protein, partial [Aliarcobacter butzleri]
IPAFKDPNKKHISLVFSMASIVFVQIAYFLSVAEIVNVSSYKILLLSLGLFLVLILLALRRISMESINELLEKQQIDEIFLAKSF